jgi:hypothetical protein
MERTRQWVVVFLGMLSIAAVLLGSGCAKKEIASTGPIRYQQVEIPGYQKQDYENLLSHESEDVRSNAICNLIPHAAEYGRILSKTKAGDSVQPNPPIGNATMKSAQAVYDRMKEEVSGSKEYCKAVGLIFLGEFASNYSEKKEVADLVLSIETKDPRIQYEQLDVMDTISRYPYYFDPVLLKPFLESRAWIIRSKTYGLLDGMACDELHPLLIQAYDKSTLESDKIQIVHAFRNGYGPEVFDLLRREINENRNERIKREWAAILKRNCDEAAVFQWIMNQNTAIDAATMKSIADSYMDELNNPQGQRFFKEILVSHQARWIDAIEPELFFKNLYDALRNEAMAGAVADLETVVLSSDRFKEAWRLHKAQYAQEARAQEARTKKEEQLFKAILPKYNVLLKTFLKDSEKLFLAEGMDRQEVEETTESIRELLDLTREEQ